MASGRSKNVRRSSSSGRSPSAESASSSPSTFASLTRVGSASIAFATTAASTELPTSLRSWAGWPPIRNEDR